MLQRPLFRPSTIGVTAFRPDVAVVDETKLDSEPLWSEQSILTQSHSIKLIAEVVSSNWQNDYSRKLEDYENLEIPEYWIADYAGLGGTRYIGSPKQPTLSICALVDRHYQIRQFRASDRISSLLFPHLDLTAAQVLRLTV